MDNTLIIELIACCVFGGLYGSIRAYARMLRKRKQYEQRELLRWQTELEKKASEIHKNNFK